MRQVCSGVVGELMRIARKERFAIVAARHPAPDQPVVAAHVQAHFAALVAHHQLAARMHRRQRDDERREPARRFLGVAVADEMAALVVDRELVQIGRHGVGHSKPGGGSRHEGLQGPCPALACGEAPQQPLRVPSWSRPTGARKRFFADLWGGYRIVAKPTIQPRHSARSRGIHPCRDVIRRRGSCDCAQDDEARHCAQGPAIPARENARQSGQ
jgi:hypothetical protein